MVIDKTSWRYRAWAATFPDKAAVPERTSLCAMFWTTVLFWGLLVPVGSAILVVVLPIAAPVAWIWGRLPYRARLGIGALGAAAVGAAACWAVIAFGWWNVLVVVLFVALLVAGAAAIVGVAVAVGWLIATVIKRPLSWLAPKIGARIDDTIGRETLRAWKERVCPLIQFTDAAEAESTH